MNGWGGLSLGGAGRMDANMAMPVGNTGPGGAVGMGLMALLRKMGMAEPEPMPADPVNDRAMAEMLGLVGPSEDDLAATGQTMMPLGETSLSPDDLAATGQPMQRLMSPEEEAMAMGFTPEEMQRRRAMYQMEMQKLGALGLGR